MGNPLVSVIMPVYNGQQFLQKSVGSILRQTYQNIEFIAVDDGSDDQSLKLLEEYKKSMPEHIHMRIISQKNQGICQSRNHALDLAEGKYIMFIDQDDDMEEDCVQYLCREIEEQNADMVIGGFNLVDETGAVIEKWLLDPKLAWSKFQISAPWGRIFRKEIIDQYQIRFMVTKISEDFYFNMLYMSYCQNIFVVSYQGYHWLYNEKSESRANMSRLSEERNLLAMLTKLHADMKKPNILEPEYVEYMVIKHIIWYLFYVAKKADSDGYRRLYDDCMGWIKDYYPYYQQNVFLKSGKVEGENRKIGRVVMVAMFLIKIHLFYPILRVYSKI